MLSLSADMYTHIQYCFGFTAELINKQVNAKRITLNAQFEVTLI